MLDTPPQGVYDSSMSQTQIKKTIHALEAELKGLDLQRETLLDALISLRRLMPVEEVISNGSSQESKPDFPGLTEAILSIVEAGSGRPVSAKMIRNAFARNGWIKTKSGQDRSKTIYETLRRQTVAGKLEKAPQGGYVISRKDRRVQQAQFLDTADTEWRTLPRTDAVAQMMAQQNRPLRPMELSKLLISSGRSDDSTRNVSAALAYLKKQGRVESASPGYWILTSQRVESRV